MPPGAVHLKCLQPLDQLLVPRTRLVLLIVVLVLIRYGDDVADAAINGVAAVAAVSVVVAMAARWIVAASSDGSGVVVALVTAICANGLALAIAQASFPARPAVRAAVVTFGVVSVVMPVVTAFLIAGWHNRRGLGMAKPGPSTVGG